MARPFVAANTQLPEEYEGDFEIHVVSGQSRGNCHSQGTGSCMVSMLGAQNPERSLMMSNARAPSHAVESDFAVGDASSFVPYEDSRDTKASQVTINVATSTVTWPGHTLGLNDNVIFDSYAGTWTLNVTRGDTYRVTNANQAAGTFQITTTVSGPALTMTGTATGTVMARNVSSRCPLGQPLLGAFLYALDQDDVTYGLPRKRRIGVCVAEGGQKITVIKGDTLFTGAGGTFNLFTREQNMIQTIKNIATAQGRGCYVATRMHLQGEADMLKGTAETDPATWETNTRSYLTASNAAIASITGQTTTPETFFDVMSGFGSDTGDAGWSSAILAKMVERAVENPTGHYRCTGPGYGYPYWVTPGGTAGAHMHNEAVVRLGEAWAEDWTAIRLGTYASPLLRALMFTTEGNSIIIKCRVPVGTLRIDTTTIPAATGTSGAGRTFVKGFELEGGTISAVSVSGRYITITCTASPVGKTLRYAWHGLGSSRYTCTETGREDAYTPGSWGNIRDERATAGVYSPITRRNWLCPFEQVL